MVVLAGVLDVLCGTFAVFLNEINYTIHKLSIQKVMFFFVYGADSDSHTRQPAHWL